MLATLVAELSSMGDSSTSPGDIGIELAAVTAKCTGEKKS